MVQDKLLDSRVSKTNESVSGGFINNLIKSEYSKPYSCFIREIVELHKSSLTDEQRALIECVARYGPNNTLNPYSVGNVLKDYSGSIFKEEKRVGQKYIRQIIRANICILRSNKKSELSFSQNPDYRIDRYLRTLFPGLAVLKIYVKCEEGRFPYDLKITLMSKLNMPHEHHVIYTRAGHPTTYRYITGDVLAVEIRGKESKPREWMWKVAELNSECHQLIISPEHGILSDYIL
ncbi:MAG: hypothetical protein ABI337_08290, partial [Nitrososphaera sp.]|jgi:hypothetical protein